MNKLRLVTIASLLVTGVAQAVPCDSFKIKIKNNLSDDLLVTRIQLHGADIQPNGIQTLNKKSEEVFTINNSSGDHEMQGELVFHTMRLPSNEVNIKFNLKNAGLICEHTNTSPKDGAFDVEHTRLPGQVNYSITNK